MLESTLGESLAGSFLPAALMLRVNVARYVSANRRCAVTLATITLPKKVELLRLLLANILQRGLLAPALVSAVYSKALRYGEQSTVGLAVLSRRQSLYAARSSSRFCGSGAPPCGVGRETARATPPAVESATLAASAYMQPDKMGQHRKITALSMAEARCQRNRGHSDENILSIK
jgi:hypothetical protein